MDFPSSLVSSYVGFVFHFYLKGGGGGIIFLQNDCSDLPECKLS
jgi:hypothetical protein